MLGSKNCWEQICFSVKISYEYIYELMKTIKIVRSNNSENMMGMPGFKGCVKIVWS
jgi:hypothetical protein